MVVLLSILSLLILLILLQFIQVYKNHEGGFEGVGGESGRQNTEVAVLLTKMIFMKSRLNSGLWSENMGDFSRVASVSDNKKNRSKKVDDVAKGDLYNSKPSVKVVNRTRFDPINFTKNLFLERLIGLFSKDKSLLIAGMVLGIDGEFSKTLDHSFEITGMQHVLVASGSNVALVVASLLFVLRRFWRSRWVLCLGGLLGTWIYALAVGLEPPILRAAIMSSVSLLSFAQRKQYRSWWGIVWVVAIVSIWSPDMWESLSFQLSLAATLGVIFVYPLISRGEGWLSLLETGSVVRIVDDFQKVTEKSSMVEFWDFVRQPFVESFYMTVAAQSLIIPLLFFYFGKVSVVSFVANTFLLWLVPIVTLLGFVFLLFTIVAYFLPIINLLVVGVITPMLWLVCELFIRGITFFGEFESGVIELSFSKWQVVGWWVGIVMASWFYGHMAKSK